MFHNNMMMSPMKFHSFINPKHFVWSKVAYYHHKNFMTLH